METTSFVFYCFLLVFVKKTLALLMAMFLKLKKFKYIHYTSIGTANKHHPPVCYSVDSVLLQAGEGSAAETDPEARRLVDLQLDISLAQSPGHLARLTFGVKHNDSIRIFFNHAGKKNGFELYRYVYSSLKLGLYTASALSIVESDE